MFTGFASENTPAIQVHDFFRTFASATATRSVSLPDDCAPIQVFRTGSTAASSIRVYLPTAPIEGKQITIVNQIYNVNTQRVEIYSSDRSGDGASLPLFGIGPADSLILVYSKQNITYGPSTGAAQSGWIALNKSSTAAVNHYAAIVGGDNHSAVGQYGFVGGGESCSVSGPYGAILGGVSNTASGSYSAVVGGVSSAASSTYSAVLGGNSNGASGQSACVVGGQSSTANAANSGVFVGLRGTVRAITGNTVFPASSSPITTSAGVSQSGLLVLGRQTTDATATVLASNNSAASTTNQVILPNNSAYYVKGSIIATVTGGGNTKSWDFIATIKRGANAAATSIVGAVTLNVQAADAGAATWIVAITADTTNGGLAVTVTGQAATTIRWVAKLESTEVTY
jgi:hypothetical protein